MKKLIIIPICILVIVFLVYSIINKNNINVKDQTIPINNVKVVDLGSRKDKEFDYKSYLFKSYNEYKAFMDNYDTKPFLKEKDFENSDYIVDFQSYSPCKDELPKELVEIDIKDSVMNFKYDVYNKCGDCEELTYKAYFVPVKKGKLKELLPINPVFNNKNTEEVC